MSRRMYIIFTVVENFFKNKFSNNNLPIFCWVNNRKKININLETSQNDQIKFTLEEGTYDFLCSFPGHFATMNGKIKAVKYVK